MKKIIKLTGCLFLLFQVSSAHAWQWKNWWHTPDQQAAKLLQSGKAAEAAKTFTNKDWQAVATYRAGNYDHAFQQFGKNNTSDSQYNAGNAAAYQGKYQEAIAAYDKALALNPGNNDASANRDIIKKLLEKQKQEQEQKNGSDKNDKDKAKNDNTQANGKDGSKDKKDKQSSFNNSPQEKAGNKTQQSSAKPEDQSVSGQARAQDEDQKQLLRRINDNPGGLLRQKFLRDYFRHHSNGEDPDQGVN